MEEQVIWHDGFGNKHQTAVLAKHTYSFGVGNFSGSRSWVATWHPRKNEPIWLDIREIDEFI